MTYVLDTSAILAQALDEPGADRVEELLSGPEAVVCVSVLTLYEVWTSFFHLSANEARAFAAVDNLKEAVSEIVPIDEDLVRVGIGLRAKASTRIALADSLVAATAVRLGAVLVHRDSHFDTLPLNTPLREVLPEKSA